VVARDACQDSRLVPPIHSLHVRGCACVRGVQHSGVPTAVVPARDALTVDCENRQRCAQEGGEL
jgi:hypothetical protein